MQEIELGLKLNNLYSVTGAGHLESCFSVSQLANASIGAIGSALSSLLVEADLVSRAPKVEIDQRLASLWFS